MKILTKYILKNVISYVMLVMIFLLGLHLFVEFLHEFPSIGIANYGLYKVLICVVLMLPYDLYQFFPMACLLGSVIAIGLLASHSELTVMRVSGMSLANITFSVLQAAIVLLIVMILIGEVLSPIAQRKSFQIKTAAMSGGQALVTQGGIWLHDNHDIINIASVSETGELQGITRYRYSDDKKLQFVSYANKGIYKKGTWVFSDIKYTKYDDNTINSYNIQEESLALKISKYLIGIDYYADADQKNLLVLYSYIKHRVQSGLDVASYKFAFWQRIFAPLATLVMVLLAVPFVFGLLRGATMGLRMLVGMIFGFGFYILHQFVGPMSIVYHVLPILAALLPSLVFAAIGSFLLCKVR